MANKVGRPKKQLDPNAIRLLVSQGVKITEIADLYSVSPDTIHNNYSADILKGRAELKKNLRQWQLEAARQGNSALLIWLGKQYLGQTDSAIDEHVLSAISAAGITKEDLIELIKNKDKHLKDFKPKSFEDFCKDAGYPKPYPKQLEMMAFGINHGEPRLLLGARGYGKSDYVTVMGVAYDVYLNKLDTSNLIISKSKSRNTAMIGEIKEALIKNGVNIDKSNSNFIRVSGLTGKDHSVEVLTIKSSFRGRHPKRIIMDDPVTEEDTSEAMRVLVKKKYDEAYKLCKNICIIGQPAHKFDLYAELRPTLQRLEIPHGQIPELDMDLEAMRLAGVTESSIQMSYHLTIPSEGTTAFDNIKYLDNYPLGDSVAFIDPSHEGGDFTALTVLRAYMQGVAVEGYVFKKAWNHCLDDIAPILNSLKVKKLAFETNALGDMPIDILRKTFKTVGVVGRRTVTNKHSRIMAAGTYSHLIHLSKKSAKAYIDQVVQYEYRSKHDDAPDSLASCLEWIGLIKGKE